MTTAIEESLESMSLADMRQLADANDVEYKEEDTRINLSDAILARYLIADEEDKLRLLNAKF